MIFAIVLITLVLVLSYGLYRRTTFQKEEYRKNVEDQQLNAHPDALAVRLGKFAEDLQHQADEARRLSEEALKKAQGGHF